MSGRRSLALIIGALSALGGLTALWCWAIAGLRFEIACAAYLTCCAGVGAALAILPGAPSE